MFKTKLNQRGDATMIALLIVVVVAVGALFYWKYQQVQKDVSKVDTSVPKASEKKNVAANPVNNTKYLMIKEWGVKIPLDDVALSYTIKSSVINVRSTELDTLSDSCKSNSVDIARGKANEVVPNEIGSDTGATFKQTYDSRKAENDVSTVNVIVGEYYYVTPNYAGASCSESSAGQAKEDLAITAIKKQIALMIKE